MMEITGQTKIMFILADPVGHIRGSAILTKQLNEAGCNVAVSPLHVKPADLGTVIATLRLLHNVPGFGITIPHKIPVRQYLDGETARAAKVGSVNFVKRESDGRLIGDNVDGVGFVDGLVRSGISLKGKRVLQIGAGGAGRSIAFSIAEAGATVLNISNRTAEKGAALAAAVKAAYPACDAHAGGLDPSGFDVIVNTTSVGMKPTDPMLIDADKLTGDMAVAEIIMTPEFTPLLLAAQQRGCKISLGKHMLEEQVRRVKEFFAL
jgi:shikimate dehydrogenase